MIEIEGLEVVYGRGTALETRALGASTSPSPRPSS
jgi:hypothetical protein